MKRTKRWPRNRRLARRIRIGALVLAFVLPLPTLGRDWGLYLVPFVPWILAFLTVLVHEAGHAIGAIMAGGRVTLLTVRPFTLRFRPLRLRWQGGPFLSGRTEYVFGQRHGRRYALATIGGPLASALLCLMMVRLATTGVDGSAGPGLPWALAAVAAADTVANLLPFRGSDGASLAALLRATRWRRARTTVRANVGYSPRLEGGTRLP